MSSFVDAPVTVQSNCTIIHTFHGFKTLYDLTIRHRMRYWNSLCCFYMIIQHVWCVPLILSSSINFAHVYYTGSLWQVNNGTVYMGAFQTSITLVSAHNLEFFLKQQIFLLVMKFTNWNIFESRGCLKSCMVSSVNNIMTFSMPGWTNFKQWH